MMMMMMFAGIGSGEKTRWFRVRGGKEKSTCRIQRDSFSLHGATDCGIAQQRRLISNSLFILPSP